MTDQPQETDAFGACAVAAEEAEKEDGCSSAGEDGGNLVEGDEWTGAGQQVKQLTVQLRLTVDVEHEAEPEQRQTTHLVTPCRRHARL